MNNKIRQAGVSFIYQAYQTDSEWCKKSHDSGLSNSQILEKVLWTSDSDNYKTNLLHLVHHLSHATYIGYYSIWLNNMAKDSDLFHMFKLKLPLLNQFDLFPEFYSQIWTDEDYQWISDRLDIEYRALELCFEKVTNNLFRSSQNWLSEDLEVKDMYSRMFNQVKVGNRTDKPIHKWNLPTWSGPIKSQVFVEHGQRCYLPVKTLLQTINGINPITGELYTEHIINSIRKKFSPELKLIHDNTG